MYFRGTTASFGADGAGGTIPGPTEIKVPELKPVASVALVTSQGAPLLPAWATDTFWARHRWYVRGTAILHLVNAAVVSMLGYKRNWPQRLCATYVRWLPDNPDVRCFESFINPSNEQVVNVCRIRHTYRFIGEVSVVWLVATFFLLSFAFQFAPAATENLWRKYRTSCENGVQSLRYIEYSISSSLMVIILFVLNGTTEFWTILIAVSANFSVMLFGLVQEQLTFWRLQAGPPPTREEFIKVFAPHLAGWLPFVFMWAAIIGQFSWAIDAVDVQGDDTALGFVKAIFATQFVMFFAFGACQFFGTLAHTYRISTKIWSYLHSEIAFTALSFTAKTLLAYLLLFGVIMRDPSKLVPLAMC